MTVQVGILLALCSAFAMNVGFLCKHRGARAAPDIRWNRPLRSALGLFRSPWFALGIGVALVGWVLHVGALAVAPISVVQTVIAGGLVFLTVLADRLFGCVVGMRQWLGVGLTALGLVLLAVTLPGNEGASSSYSLAGMIPFVSSLLGVGILLVLAPALSSRGGPARQHQGVLLGASAGLLFGVSDVSLKALTGVVGQVGILGLISPWTGVAMVASLIGFYASARGFQTGEAVPVITLTLTANNLTAIGGGILVFGDPLAGSAFGIVVQALAFVLVIGAAALTPAPVRAAEVVET